MAGMPGLSTDALKVTIGLDAQDYMRGMDAAIAKDKEFEGEVGNTGGVLGKLKGPLAAVGKAAVAGFAVAGAAAVGFGAKSVSVAADFESQMNILSIAAANAGTSMDKLQEAALAAGADTRLVGIDASQSAEAMTNLYKAGLTTDEIFGDLNATLEDGAEFGGAFRAAVDLQAASELNLAESSDLAAVALATFGGEMETEAERAEFVNKALNNFVKAADASVAEVSGLAQALKAVGPTASAFGFGIEETNNALAILSTRGIQGSEAGTALKSMFAKLLSGTKPVNETLDALGVSLFDAQGNMKDLRTIVGDLQGAMSGLTQKQKLQAQQTLAGTFGMKAMQTLLAEGTAGWDAMAEAVDGAAGIQEQAAARTKGFNASMEALGGTLETLQIKVGAVLLPILTDLVDKFAEFVGDVTPQVVAGLERVVESVQTGIDAFNTFRPILDTVIELFDRLADLVAPIASAIQGALAQAFAFVQDNLAPFEGALKGVTLALAGLAAPTVLGAVTGALTTMAGVIMGPVIAALGAILSPIGLVVAAAAGLGAAWETNFLGIQDKTQMVFDRVTTILNDVLAPFNSLVSKVQTSVANVKSALETGGIKAALQTVVSEARALWPEFVAALQEAGERLRTHLSALASEITGWISNQAAVYGPKLTGEWIPAFLDWASDAASQIGEKLTEIAVSITTWISDQAAVYGPKLTAMFSAAFSNAVSALGSLADQLGPLGAKLLTGLTGVIEGIDWATVGRLVAQMLVGALGAIVFVAAEVVDFISSLVTALTAGASNADYGPVAGGLKSALGAAFTEFAAGFGEVIQPVIDAIKTKLETTFPGLASTLGTVTSAITRVADSLREKLSGAVAFIQDHLAPFEGALKGVMGAFAALAGAAGLQLAIGALTAFAGLLTGAVIAALGAVLSPIALVVAAAAGLGAAWETNFLGIRDKTKVVLDFVQEKITTVIGIVTAFWEENHEAILATANRVWETIQTTIKTIIETVQTVIETTVGAIKSFWDENQEAIRATAETIWDAIEVLVGTAIDNIKVVIETTVGVIGGIIDTALALWEGDWGGAWEAIKGTVTTLITGIKTIIDNTLNAIKVLVIEPALGAIQGAWDNAWNAMATKISGVWDTMGSTVKGGVNTIIGFINRLIDAWNGLEFHIPGFDVQLPSVDIPGVGTVGGGNLGWGGVTIGSSDLARIAELAKGGIIEQPTLGLLGEAGPEAVVPLQELESMLSLRGAPIGGNLTGFAPQPAASGGSNVRIDNISVQVQIDDVVDQELVRTLQREISEGMAAELQRRGVTV